MRDLRPGVWHWQSPHPDWNEEQWWPELVSSYAIELGDDFLLFDPLSVPDELPERATAVVLTAPHRARRANGSRGTRARAFLSGACETLAGDSCSSGDSHGPVISGDACWTPRDVIVGAY
jgi:hypothetical protein